MNETVVAVLKARHLWLSKPAKACVVFFASSGFAAFLCRVYTLHTLQGSKAVQIFCSLISQTPIQLEIGPKCEGSPSIRSLQGHLNMSAEPKRCLRPFLCIKRKVALATRSNVVPKTWYTFLQPQYDISAAANQPSKW